MNFDRSNSMTRTAGWWWQCGRRALVV